MTAINLGTIKKNVLRVIMLYPEAADNDAMLFDVYWHMFDGWDDNKSTYWNLSRVTNPETLTRRRRELHNAGLIKYSETSMKRREEAYTNEKDRAKAVAKGDR